jgi:hypothetical protein
MLFGICQGTRGQCPETPVLFMSCANDSTEVCRKLVKQAKMSLFVDDVKIFR